MLVYKGFISKGRGMKKEGCKCAICKETIPYENEEVVIVKGLKGYGIRNTYFHERCFKPRYYHDDRIDNITGTKNYTDYREGDISLEVEAVSTIYSSFERAIFGDENGENYDEAYRNVYVTSLMWGSKRSGHGRQNERDCTVLDEKHNRGKDLTSISKWFHSLSEEELDTMRDDRCGCHMHVSCQYTHLFDNEAKYGTDLQRNIRLALWHPFLVRIREMTIDEQIKYFGRTFTTYARNDKGEHGDAINLHTGYNTVEFRLPHVRTADQIIKCAKMWRAVVNLINDNGALIEGNLRMARYIGHEMAKQIDIMIYGNKFSKGR